VTGPALAFAASPRDWPERLHRFLMDHGGARVRVHVLRSEEALDEEYEVLVVDDVCSFLTPHLVHRVRAAGRSVLGVYDPTEFPEGKDRLLEYGIADVIEAQAPPEEMLEQLRRLGVASRHPAASEHVEVEPPPATMLVGAPPGGAGATETAIALAARLGRRFGGCTLVDGDDSAPSVAQRLGLPLHPNLVTAIDEVHHGPGGVGSWLVRLDGDPIGVVPGVPGGSDRIQLQRGEVEAVLARLRSMRRPVVVDGGTGVGAPRPSGMAAAVVASAAVLVAVGSPSPVGVTRLLDWTATVRALQPDLPVHVLVNRAPTSRFRRSEVAREIARTLTPAGLWFAPEDRAVGVAAWNGAPAGSGGFRRACDRMADTLARMVPVS
jgi:MinD-like ATPase involved in chromosome partitioning or flagellar assembly